MNPRIGFLEAEIPILEAKLKALKRERRTLINRELMAAKWKDPIFRAKALASIEARKAKQAAHLIGHRFNGENKLPWPVGTKERNKYRSLQRKGWTRELAIEKVRASA